MSVISKQNILLKKRIPTRLSAAVQLTSSKSESNRLLLIRALATNELILENLSEARDTQTMKILLEQKPAIWDVKDAGTTMRFLTAYLAVHGNGQTITGTKRMKLRPISALVDALRVIGADIQYLEEEGFPPLRISKIEKQLTNEISIPGNISSQYISALLMIAPCLPDGLRIKLTAEVFSRPYIHMTLKLMSHFQVDHTWEGSIINIRSQSYSKGSYFVESDWSGASYWYSFIALSPEREQLFLPNLHADSTQGDQEIIQMMKSIGVITHFENGGVRIKQGEIEALDQTIDFRDCPDLAQTVMVVAAAKGIRLTMTGLESLRIKETDRIKAMQTEVAKLGAALSEKGDCWILKPSFALPEKIEVATYDDHRMAMAFAPLCHLMDVTIENPEVVNKSYPEFWEEREKLEN
ncbi:MAG: 3-phosphoshikimate 1-carboxyvinyltransferase [Gammaproteobacteria bacterium]|nr:3-phosphoshikimate 1-carboxyvinyltransferase [Gammaproteobacteria bacterium]